MMLRPQDVGSGYTAEAASGGDWTFEFNAAVLGCRRGTRPDALAERNRTLRKGRPQAENFVNQETSRYSGDEAADYLNEIKGRVAGCAQATVAAQGFAGDESLLVVFDHGGGNLAKIVLVRVGDVLTEIYAKPVRSDAASRELGRKAAARL
jgi:hypothetical protein